MHKLRKDDFLCQIINYICQIRCCLRWGCHGHSLAGCAAPENVFVRKGPVEFYVWYGDSKNSIRKIKTRTLIRDEKVVQHHHHSHRTAARCRNTSSQGKEQHEQ
jgi:hypothetical protein